MSRRTTDRLGVARAALVVVALAGLAGSLGAVACSATEPSAADAGSEPFDDGGDAAPAPDAPRYLVFGAGCRPELCAPPPRGRLVVTCTKDASGACAWDPPPASDAATSPTTSPAPCAEGACGVEPAPLVCPDRYVPTPPSCTRELEPACGWRLTCSVVATDEVCASPGCGPSTFDIPFCAAADGGRVEGSRECRKTSFGDCAWTLLCPAGSVP